MLACQKNLKKIWGMIISLLTVFGWLFLGIVYGLMGYQIAIISRRVADKWEETNQVEFYERIVLYPGSTINFLGTIRTFEGTVKPKFRNSSTYVVLHLFFWIFRIVINVMMWPLLSIVTYIIAVLCFCGYMLFKTIGDIIGIIHRTENT